MTVVYRKEADKRFNAEDVIWAKEDLVKALVRYALIGQTEATVDMAVDNQRDMEADELTRNGLQMILNDVKVSAEDFLNDVLADLKTTTIKALADANYGAIVTGIKYDLAGEIKDIEVDVTVN